ncbi:MAG: hypothetical protein EBE86_018675 [Hormoscilla sp. GUM202]|nr:hypothetical protein [Hormoscilla sp. GUM202]
MPQNNNDIWTFLHRSAIIVTIIAGIISPIVAVLTFLEIKPFQTQQKTTLPSPEQTPSQPKSETLPSSPEQTPSQPKSETLPSSPEQTPSQPKSETLPSSPEQTPSQPKSETLPSSPEQTPSQPKSETLPSSPEQTPSQPKSETPERPTQDSTLTRPPDRTAPRVDRKKAMLVKALTGHSSDVLSVAIAPDGKTLVSGSSDKTIKIWQAGP